MLNFFKIKIFQSSAIRESININLNKTGMKDMNYIGDSQKMEILGVEPIQNCRLIFIETNLLYHR